MTSDIPKISIIMPVYNMERFLEKSIESVSKQTLKDLELICIDDGSTDESLNLLNEFSKRYSFIKIVTQQNKGFALARNLGIKKAAGEYIAFLDAGDVFYDVDALERMYNANVQDAEMISANRLMIGSDNKPADNFVYTKHKLMFFDDDSIIEPEEYGVPLSFYKNIFKREFLIDNNIFFADFKNGENHIFLSKVLTLIDRIQGVSLNLHGSHFCENNIKIIDFLANTGIFENRTLNLIESNLEHLDCHMLWNDLYNIYSNSFDEFQFNYLKFKINSEFYFITKIGGDEFYKQINKEFLMINIYNSQCIDELTLNKYFLVVFSYTFDELISNYENFLKNNIDFNTEFNEFKIRKFIFNLDISNSEVVFENTKKLISNLNVWEICNIPQIQVKKCFKVINSENIDEYKRNTSL